MVRHFENSKRRTMRRNLNSEDSLFCAPTQINFEDFDLTADYGSRSSFECTSAVSTRIPMSTSTSGWTLEDDRAKHETNAMLPKIITCVQQYKSQSDHLIVSPIVVQSSMNVARYQQLQTRTIVCHMNKLSIAAVQNSTYNLKPFEIVEKSNKSPDERTQCALLDTSGMKYASWSHDILEYFRVILSTFGGLWGTLQYFWSTLEKMLTMVKNLDFHAEGVQGISSNLFSVPSLICSSVNYESISDRNIPVSPRSCTSVPYFTRSTEEPPILHLHKNPVELAFPDRLSCAISKHPERGGLRRTNEPLLSATNFSNNFLMNVQRTVSKKSKGLSENAALERAVHCWKSLGD